MKDETFLKPTHRLAACYSTSRLLLRRSHESLAHAVTEYYSRNKQFLHATETTHEEAYYALPARRKALQEDEEKLLQDSAVRFWISRKGETRIIGTISLSCIVRGAFQSCFLGYKLDEAYLRRGYMTEAVEKCLEIAFCELGLHRVEANIMPRNTASRGVVQKLGFEPEGLARRYLEINGVWEDHLRFAKRNE